MDFKSLLQSMDNISETVHKAGPGGYGNRHGSETQTDQYGKPIGKVSLASLAPKDDKPKSRGRPVDPDKPKTGKDDPKNKKVGDIFGRTTGDVPKGKKGSQHTPMKDADKEEKKAEKKSLKDWIEASEVNQLNEADQVTIAPAQQNTQVIKQGDETLGTVTNPQLAAQIKQSLGKGEMTLAGDNLGEEFDKPVKTDPSEKGKYKGKSKSELLKAYNHLKKTGPHEKGSKQYENMKELAFAIRAKGDWGKVQEEQVEEGGYRGRDAYSRDQYSATTGFDKKDSYAYQQDGGANDEGWEDEKPSYPRTSDRMRQAQQRHYGFKRPSSESVEEAKDLPGNQERIAGVEPPKDKITAKDLETLRNKKKVKESISFNEMMDETHSDMQDMLQELQQDIDNFNSTGHCSDKLEAFLKVHGHNKKKITDEGEFTQHYMDANKPSSIRQRAEIAKAPQQHTPWSVDPINAATDRAGSFLKNLGQPKKTFEGKNMKDIQLENWEKELNSLLNEGITVSSSTGQQGSPDSVSVNATDGDAQQLLQVLRSAGVGVFGGEQEHSDYGAPMGGHEPTGAGSEPEMSPAVVGDGDDMMALIKKMSGIQDSGEPEGIASSDYESEEGSDDDHQAQHGSDGHSHEEDGKEETDEGSEWTEKLKDTPQGGEFTIGGKEYTDTSSLEEEGKELTPAEKDEFDKKHPANVPFPGYKGKVKEAGHDHGDHGTCNECGMFEARCVCEPGEEQVEEGQLDEKFGGNAAQNAQYNKAHTGEWMRSPDRLQNRQDDIEAGNLPPEELKKRMQGVAKTNIRNTWPGHQTKSKLPGAARPAYRGPDNPYAEGIEEDYANEAGHEEMAQLKHLLSMGNDMHKEKRSQAVGNPTQVTFETTLLKDSTSLLQDFKKLSGIK